jgi:hypothetical protein
MTQNGFPSGSARTMKSSPGSGVLGRRVAPIPSRRSTSPRLVVRVEVEAEPTSRWVQAPRLRWSWLAACRAAWEPAMSGSS